MLKVEEIGNIDILSSAYNIPIYDIVPIHRVAFIEPIDERLIRKMIEVDPFLQFVMSLWIGNSIDDTSISFMFQKINIISLFSYNNTIRALPSLFEKVHVIFTNDVDSIGIIVGDIRKQGRDNYADLKKNRMIGDYLSDVFCFNSEFNIHKENSQKIYRVVNNIKGTFKTPKLNNEFKKYLLSQCIVMGECCIPLRGFTEKEILNKQWLDELLIIFNDIYLVTTCEKEWLTQKIIVKGINSEVMQNMKVKKPDLYSKGFIV